MAVGKVTTDFKNKHGLSTPRGREQEQEFQDMLTATEVPVGRAGQRPRDTRPIGQVPHDLARALDFHNKESMSGAMEYVQQAEQKRNEKAEKEAKKAAEKAEKEAKNAAKKAAAGKKRGQSPASQHSPNKK